MKTDERDAEMIFEHLRGHILAGNKLHGVRIPDPETRDDRELARGRVYGTDAKVKSMRCSPCAPCSQW